MVQILLIEPDESLRAILKLNIMNAIGCDVVEKQTAVDAISLLEILPNIDLIICKEEAYHEKTALKLSGFLESENHKIPLLVIGNKISNYEHLKILAKDSSWKKIVMEAGAILGCEVHFTEGKQKENYVAVAIEYFLNLTSLSLGCDVFIRIKKGEEYQYIKRLHSKDEFTRADIEKYKADGLKDFYIPSDHFSQFVNFATSQLVLKLENTALSKADRIKLSAEAYEVTLERIQSLGIDEHTVGLVEESIKSMQESLKDDKALSTFLDSLKLNKLSYGYAHSYLCGLILHKVIGHFDWKSVQVKDKLSYIAFFHDISLREDLMKYYTEEEVLNSELTKTDRSMILGHANMSAEIVSKFSSIPDGVALILKEHHGAKNGIGFPETLSIAISPMSMMFIVVENFVDEFLKINGKPTVGNFEQIFAALKTKYNKVTYEQTVVALEGMIFGSKQKAS